MNISTKELEGETRNVITIYENGHGGEYRVEAGTHSPREVYEVFRAKMVEVDNHFVILGERESKNGNEKENEKYRGIAHSKKEAEERLTQLCRSEALKMRIEYFNGKIVKFRDRI